MYAWPFYLFVFGVIVIAVAALTYSRKVMIFVPAGYIIGFLSAGLFNKDGFDPGGGLTNNGWIIWTVTLLAIILAGVAWEVARRTIKS